MYAAVNAWAVDEKLPVPLQLDRARGAGFRGLELVVGADAAVTPVTSLDECREFGRLAAEHDMRIAGVATGEFWKRNYASPTPAERQEAMDLTRRLLDIAEACEAGAVLVVPAIVGRWRDAQPTVSYQDALNRTYEALCELKADAEARSVVIAIENVWNRFLLSPVEAVELLDRVNSPYVGFYFDVGNILAYGYPEDWITTLGRRVARVHVKDFDFEKGFVDPGEGAANWPAVLAALRDVGYDGPMTYEGQGDPAEMARRLARLAAGEPPIR